jgi:DNA helicase-2/ATP-dependent DNA helicase PcrA
MTSMHPLTKDLNPQQTQAVLHDEGPAIVLAGAGSGKTKVLTTRAAWLIKEKKLTPDQILLMTFTNKAAQEMSQRVKNYSGSHLPYSGTFHRICALILRRKGQAIGLDPNYLIYDSQDQDAVIKQIYKKHGYDNRVFNRNAVKAVISKAKNKLLTPIQYQQQAETDFELHTAKVYKKYQQRLIQNQAVDFDDLLMKTIQLFESRPEILGQYQQQFIHVLVDEYQDTNKAQYRLTKLLGQPHNNIYVVGDFSQSIYAWRGADYQNLQHLQTEFPQITSYKLEQNYRSTQTILSAATQVISQNTGHPILSLWTEKTHDQPITILETKDNEDEANTILNQISTQLKNYSYQDIAILYRVNAQSRAFEEAFVRRGIPYQLIGGFKFYERKEVKDVLAYLKLLLNPQDQVSLERATKLGKRRLAKFNLWAQQQTAAIPPAQALEGILEVAQYLAKYDEKDPQDLARIENVQELVAVATKFENSTQFLENVSLVQDNHLADISNQNSQNAISLMSLHAAKGLEFPVVFIVGAEEGLLPHSRSLYDPNQLEEERRLCYVGITRAREKLYFSHAQTRWQYGQSSKSLKSRFLKEINHNLLDTQTAAGYKNKHKRRLVLDDDILDSVLSDDLDLDAFLNS